MAASAQQRNDLVGYVSVSQRIERFYHDHPTGRILTTIVERDHEAGFVLMRAEIYRAQDDAEPAATGHAYEVRGEGFVNKSFHLENCESSSVGRALANLGYETKEKPAARREEATCAVIGRAVVPETRTGPRSVPVSLEDRRAREVEEVWAICKQLNEAGDARKWTSKSLAAFVNENFQVEDGLESLGFESLGKLKAELSSRLENIKAATTKSGVS